MLWDKQNGYISNLYERKDGYLKRTKQKTIIHQHSVDKKNEVNKEMGGLIIKLYK